MIENSEWQTILATAIDISVVCEIYPADHVPTAEGFNPHVAIDCFAAVAGITFFGVPYKRMVKKFGSINRKLGPESNTASVEFSNIGNEISDFEFSHGFEGLIKVIRLISRSQSTSLALSQILFTGRCEKPESGNKTSLSVRSTWILGGLDVQIPRRKFSKEDQEGRVPADPDFEGFLFIPQYGTTTYSVRQKRGGIAGLFGFKKTVQKTLPYSSYSDLDSNRPIPEVFGTAQLLGQHIAYADVGVYIYMRTAFSEGEIADISNAYSTNSLLPLDPVAYNETMGVTGAANAIAALYPGAGNYSRTAHIACRANNTAVDTIDPAPDVVAVIRGRLVTVPDAAGSWVTTGTYSDNATAHTRFILTSEDYFKLDENWIEDNDATESYRFNDEYIIDRSLTDFIFVQQG